METVKPGPKKRMQERRSVWLSSVELDYVTRYAALNMCSEAEALRILVRLGGRSFLSMPDSRVEVKTGHWSEDGDWSVKGAPE